MTVTTLSRINREATTHDSLDALAAELVRMQATKKDFVVDTRRMTFASDEAGSSLAFDQAPADTDDTDVVAGSVSDYAHGQIADRLGIPKRYYDRMRAESPDLLDRNVSHWFYERPEARMVRMLDGNVRAFLSDRYRRLDNYDLMERAIIPALGDLPGLTFHVASLTPERMTLRAILPSTAREIGLAVGDVVQAGLQFRNSEVGAGALSVEPFVWKLDCLNGLVVNASAGLRAAHLGGRLGDDDETRRIFRDDTLAADDAAFFLKVRDAARAAVDDTLFGEVVEQMRAAASGIQIGQPVSATQTLASTFDLTDGEGQSVLASLARGGDLSRWGMVNALTDAAKAAPTFDRQEEIERMGGRLLTMGENEWRRIAVAA